MVRGDSAYIGQLLKFPNGILDDPGLQNVETDLIHDYCHIEKCV